MIKYNYLCFIIYNYKKTAYTLDLGLIFIFPKHYQIVT